MQNQGNEQNYLHFLETQNQDLRNGFSKIVNGEESTYQEKNYTKEGIIPIEFQNDWYDFEGGRGFTFDDTYYINHQSGKKYKITSTDFYDNYYWFS